MNVPPDDMPAVAARYAGRDLVTLCHSGARSAISAQALAAAGARVLSLAGGTEAWRRAGHPVEAGR
jgi:rhodanese-related sulfurtransferase